MSPVVLKVKAGDEAAGRSSEGLSCCLFLLIIIVGVSTHRNVDLTQVVLHRHRYPYLCSEVVVLLHHVYYHGPISSGPSFSSLGLCIRNAWFQ